MAGKGLTAYETVDDDYLNKRTLRKAAGWLTLWALGVGAVISGDYFGWNFGLGVGGFGGLAVATILMALMYLCMVFSIAELSAALPHAGGFYSFARSALGPLGGYVCGVTDTLEYVITPAVIVVGIGGYLQVLFPEVPVTLWWVLAYSIFVGINITGVELTLKTSLVVTLIAFLVLLAFYFSVSFTGAFDSSLLFNIPNSAGLTGDWLPFGIPGIFAALPFAMWFYLAIEQLPLAAEETHDVVRDMPRALVWGIFTLLGLSLLTLVLNTGVGGGAAAMATSEAPLGDGFAAMFGIGATTTVLTLVALAGLVASFHSIIYAYGRVLFSLSRAGYFPRWMSVTTKQQVPAIALVVGAVLGLACALIIDAFGGGVVGAALLNMAVFAAVISYSMVLWSFVVLRRKRPQLPRPYVSPLGVPGALVGLGQCLVALAACFSVQELRPGVYGVFIAVVLSLIYFLGYSRKRLVAVAPEEAVALRE